MLPARVAFVTVPALAFLGVSILCASAAEAADYTVKPDGTGEFTTIQGCANVAQAGDVCVVSAGTYDEHVQTKASGLGDDSRIVFRAQGLVRMKGFDILNAYVTIDGFQVTGYAVSYSGMFRVGTGGSYCQILNNRIYDTANHSTFNGEPKVLGIDFLRSGGQAANGCTVRGNTLSNLIYIFVRTYGNGHLFESNTFEYANSWDYLYPFGTNLVFRRNVFVRGTTMVNAGNHFDIFQVFGDGGGGLSPAENILFEENWMEGIAAAFCQMTSSDIRLGVLYNNIKNITFRRNIIANIEGNGSVVMPGLRFEHNTFYRLAHAANGMSFGGTLTRGDSANTTIKNNVLLAGGLNPQLPNSETGFYTVGGFRIRPEVIGVLVTNDPSALGDANGNAITYGIFQNLIANGYVANGNGGITAKTKALTHISEFTLDPQYDAYKASMYARLVESAAKDTYARATFSADYNYVAGSAAGGFPVKKSSGCVSGESATLYNFCEAHGVNGGDPRLRDLSNLLGPDGIPLTLDDGLKPLPGSPLCGRGEGGTDIGAYSCDPSKVFPDSVPAPRPPTNVRIQ